jgi:hypothetical protein
MLLSMVMFFFSKLSTQLGNAAVGFADEHDLLEVARADAVGALVAAPKPVTACANTVTVSADSRTLLANGTGRLGDR